MTTLSLLTALLLFPPAGGTVVFRGQPGGAGDVLVVDPTGAQPPVTALSAVTLLPLDVNARTELDGLRADRARRRADVPGAARLLLPAGRGSLYRYSRPGPVGSLHGLLVVDGGGDARSVLELQGTGPQQDATPFLPRIAVSSEGTRALAITKLDAGGNLLELDLANGTVVDRTAAVAPERFLAEGLHLDATWGTASSPSGVWSFDAAASGDAQLVPLPGAPAWYSGEIAFSSNGQYALTTAGVDEQNAHLFAFSLGTAPVQVTSAPAWISAAGYLPEHLHGPYLAISDDGTRAAWRTEGLKRELFLGVVPQLQPLASHHITSDLNYLDTIDEIGEVMFRPGTGVVVFAAGKLAAAGAPVIENLDFFQADLPAGAGSPAILNITQSNGIATPPFLLSSSLTPTALRSEPATGALIFHNQRSGGSGDLLCTLPGQTGFATLVADVKSVDAIESAGGGVFVDLKRSSGARDRELYRYSAPFSPATAPLLVVNGAYTLDRFAPRADGWFACVQSTATKELLWRFDPQVPATLAKLTSRSFFYGPTLGWQPGGELAFSIGPGGAQSLCALWPTSAAPFRLPIAVAPGFVLPGI